MSPFLAATQNPVASAAIAAGAALVGVLVGAGIDLMRGRRERRRRQRAALRNFRRELAANKRSCSSNLMLLKTEAKDLKDDHNRGRVNSLERIQTEAWTLAFLDLPTQVLSDADLLGEIETLQAICRRINADLDARERFRLQHLLADRRFLADGLSRFAAILIYPQEDLISRVDLVGEELDEFLCL